MSSLKIGDRLKLIKQVGEEIVQEDELKKLLESGEQLTTYDGFEPSGQMHIAQGIVRAININKMIKAGIKFKMYIADWHAVANNKMGGDIDKLQTVAKYFIEIWKVTGMDLKNVEFVWASDLMKHPDYWKLVIRVGTTNKLARFIRTAEFMGREESVETLTAAQMIYPCMQIVDIFLLGAKITQLGMDQRKVNMLAREVGPQLGFWKPVVVSHHMLMGLGKSPEKIDSSKSRITALKMSKSNPDTAIFMTDTTEEIERKINKAYCLEGDVKENPILEYFKYIVFESFERLRVNELRIERPEKWGGVLSVRSYVELEKLFAEKKIHPMDLKATLSKLLDQLILPVRRHFEENQEAKALLEKIKGFQVTR